MICKLCNKRYLKEENYRGCCYAHTEKEIDYFLNKKKKPVGQPRQNKDIKISKSIRVDPWKYEKIMKDFHNLSQAVDILFANYIDANSDFCKK